MEKTDYIQMISDNVSVFNIKPPKEIQNRDQLITHLNDFNEEILKIIAGFNTNLLNHFLKISLGEDSKKISERIGKLEKLSYMVSPTGNLTYLSSSQIDFILSELDSLKLDEITENKISQIGDKQLEEEFGDSNAQFSQEQALDNQLSSAGFYLQQIGYPQNEINEKLEKARKDPAKIDELFNLPPKEIYNVPPEVESISNTSTDSSSVSNNTEVSEAEDQGIIQNHIQSIQQDISDERAKKINELMNNIKDHVKEHMNDDYESVFRQMHPDRLRRAFKFLKDTKRKHDRMKLYLEWFFASHLLENIELKVEHWQVSAQSGHGNVGVYTAGVSFSRYDNIIKDFSDSKLSKVIKIARKILQKPTKKRIQKLGQDMIAETGFDEHLYFTD
ncbi:MAG: hypothetical protein GF317_08855 [Candidatus Lokiarchaeota archaeon]|nr:hypothetical protein [Candidatus Lokiarchaeota archaeon]MBD3199820.1 hypothetical protein [Candidatus Lokiarchaeota archaeon]